MALTQRCGKPCSLEIEGALGSGLCLRFDAGGHSIPTTFDVARKAAPTPSTTS